MIKSMTGFGRYENHQGDRKFTVEMKSVNHRYFDSNIKMPKKLSIFESAIRNLLKEYIQRGKVDIFITYEDFTETNVSLKYNENIAAEYVKYYQQLSEKFDLPNDIRASVIGRSPEVFTMEEQPVDEQEIWAVLETALRGACEQFVESRIREGENLKLDLIEKLDGMLTDVAAIEKRSPEILQAYRTKLTEKVKELLAAHLEIDLDTITDDSTFEDLGIDSLDAVEILMEMEDEFGIEIQAAEMGHSVKELVEYIDKKLADK